MRPCLGAQLWGAAQLLVGSQYLQLHEEQPLSLCWPQAGDAAELGASGIVKGWVEKRLSA